MTPPRGVEAVSADNCREDVTPSGVAALRMAADNMPISRSGQPWEGAAEWLRRRADAIEKHITSPSASNDRRH